MICVIILLITSIVWHLRKLNLVLTDLLKNENNNFNELLEKQNKLKDLQKKFDSLLEVLKLKIDEKPVFEKVENWSLLSFEESPVYTAWKLQMKEYQSMFDNPLILDDLFKPLKEIAQILGKEIDSYSTQNNQFIKSLHSDLFKLNSKELSEILTSFSNLFLEINEMFSSSIEAGLIENTSFIALISTLVLNSAQKSLLTPILQKHNATPTYFINLLKKKYYQKNLSKEEESFLAEIILNVQNAANPTLNFMNKFQNSNHFYKINK